MSTAAQLGQSVPQVTVVHPHDRPETFGVVGSHIAPSEFAISDDELFRVVDKQFETIQAERKIVEAMPNAMFGIRTSV